jgi:hypothetical protein
VRRIVAQECEETIMVKNVGSEPSTSPSDAPQPVADRYDEGAFSKEVLDRVLSGLDEPALRRTLEMAFQPLYELGDSVTIDMELIAELAALTKGKPVKMLGGETRWPILSSDEAVSILEGMDRWLAAVDDACHYAWESAGKPHEENNFHQQPIRLLRQILSDLKHGDRTLWTQLGKRGQGKRNDDTDVSSLKHRAAQAMGFLMGCGMKKRLAYEAVSTFAASQAARFGTGSPIPSEPTLARLASQVGSLNKELMAQAAAILDMNNASQGDRGACPTSERINAAVVFLLADHCARTFSKPRANEQTRSRQAKNKGNPRRKTSD